MKLKPFLQCGDMHLGYRQYGIPEREDDFYVSCTQIFDLAIKNKCNVVIAGDVFDMPKPPAAAVYHLQNCVRRAREAGVSTYAIEGNHDYTGNGYWLRICGVIPLDGIIETDSGRIAGIPYCRHDEFMDKLHEISMLGGADILVTHTGFSEMNGGFASDFSAEELSIDLKDTGIKYVANGHIHIFANCEYNNIKFVQTGSTEYKSSSEDTEKHVVIVTPNNNGSVELEKCDLNTRKILKAVIRNTRDLEKAVNTINRSGNCMFLAYMDSSVPSGAEVLEKAAADYSDVILRVNTISSEERKDFDRNNAIATLNEAITQYFDEGTDEYRLVKSFLANPPGIPEEVKRYMDA